MRKLLKLCALGFVALGFMGNANAQSPVSSGSVELPAGIRDQIAKVTPKTAPSAPLRLIRGVVESGSAKPAAERHFERLENGLWGVTLVITVRGAIIRRSLTLQGLVPLATVTEIAREYDSTSLVPIGKIFLSYSVTKDLKANGSTNTTALSGDLEQMVVPAMGSKFSVEHSWDAQTSVTTSGLFGGTRTSNRSLSLKQTCTAKKEGDAASLHGQLRGKYLLVSCEGTLNNGSTRSEQYAFLPDSGLYVLLSTATDGHEDKYTITEVEYAN